MKATAIRTLLGMTTTLLALGAAGLVINAFYPLTALLSVVLVITYILLGPVNLMEKGLSLLFQWIERALPRVARFGKTACLRPRPLAVLMVYFIFFSSLTIGGFRYLPLLGKQLYELSQKMSGQVITFSEQAIDWVDQFTGPGAIRTLFAEDIRNAERQGILPSFPAKPSSEPTPPSPPVSPAEKQVIKNSILQKTFTQLENALAGALPDFISLMGGTVNGLLYGLASILLTFYVLSDEGRIRENALALFPASARRTVDYLLQSFHQVMFAFVKGQVMLGMLTGLYMGIIYWLFHVPYAILLGSLFALAELLPIVGTWIGIGTGLLVILFNMDPIVAVWVWLCSYSYQTIKDNILAPKVVGNVMGLHPLVIMLALLIGAQSAGVLGILMALPLASAVNVVIRLLLHKDPETLNLTGNNSHV